MKKLRKLQNKGAKSKMIRDKTRTNVNNKLHFTVVIMGLMLLLIISLPAIPAMTIKAVETTPKEIAPGQTAKISLGIENAFSEDVDNVNVALDLSGNIPIAPYQGSSEESIEEIKEGDEEKFSFSVIVLPDAPPGVYKIPVLISYELNGTKKDKRGTISVLVNSPPRVKIFVEGYLIKGEEGTFEIRIVNDGLSDLKLVSIQLRQPFSGATINSPLYEYLGNIDSDDFETVENRIFVGENSISSISIPIKISYKDSTNKDFVQEETLSVKVYSQEEARNLGLIQNQSYTLYVIAGIVILLYIFYRIRKRVNKKKKLMGA